MTHVTIINGSPKLEKGNTSFVLKPFIEGLEIAGASVELIYVTRMNIQPCIGCFKCWRETIGECFVGDRDDMKAILTKLRETDLLVLATPTYSPLPGQMQNFINRLVPLYEPILEFREGRTRAKFHDDVKISKMVALVVGGWWELENLDIVSKIVEELTELTGVELIGPIRRPHANLLRSETDLNKEIIERLRKIGYDLIKNSRIEVLDLEFIHQPLMKQEDYLERSNQNYLKRKANQ